MQDPVPHHRNDSPLLLTHFHHIRGFSSLSYLTPGSPEAFGCGRDSPASATLGTPIGEPSHGSNPVFYRFPLNYVPVRHPARNVVVERVSLWVTDIVRCLVHELAASL